VSHVCRLDSLPTASCTNHTSARYANLLDGSHTFTVQAVFDPFAQAVADLYAYTPVSYQWSIGTPPRTHFSIVRYSVLSYTSLIGPPPQGLSLREPKPRN
jgi:hypothetical protein